MLIKCPECGKEISDHSEKCIHCGYPLKKQNIHQNSNICIIDGTPRDLSEHIKNLNNGQFRPFKQLVEEYNMSLADASVLWEIIETTKQIPKEYNSSQKNEYREKLNAIENKNIPKCPICQSTNIQKISGLSKEGSVAIWGIFSRKVHKQWHCNNCKSDF